MKIDTEVSHKKQNGKGLRMQIQSTLSPKVLESGDSIFQWETKMN